jgi:hypothetical protein
MRVPAPAALLLVLAVIPQRAGAQAPPGVPP